MIKLISSNIGHLFNFIGGVLIAISVGIHPHGVYTTDNGIKMPMAVIKSMSFFQHGIGIMIAGFILSIAYCVTNMYTAKNKINGNVIAIAKPIM